MVVGLVVGLVVAVKNQEIVIFSNKGILVTLHTKSTWFFVQANFVKKIISRGLFCVLLLLPCN